MKARKFSKDGKFLSEVDLPASLFAPKNVSQGAIYDAIKAENANLRQGTHSTKDRGEVRGGGKKPWSQKGTGRARQGSSRAPHWVGGGIIHGPKPRDYSIRLSRNVKRKAVVSILNKKAEEARINILEDLSLNTYSTKTVANVFKNMGLDKTGNIGLVVAGESKEVKSSVRNIPTVKYINSKRVVCRELLYNNSIVITESALNELVEQYKGVVEQ
ncbi:MAG TPA: 50S ribosomal protein L4 [Leptospiraceae bacterium]|nr:50S ribosomal protein L4 [Leptospiraceae bacterium]HMY66223.1 50S ribosomal protein L4 [Leptospiraceae bacterium]HNF13838.1 50S ribosomal protein L4 [Leptospiraceae bacterium]HNF23581.1 50S ribosomal protein L4 [Leptospiraceae bacterium]HNH06970.1 50S ribosomal protein L4 [Leptospiraceae bacterium]